MSHELILDTAAMEEPIMEIPGKAVLVQLEPQHYKMYIVDGPELEINAELTDELMESLKSLGFKEVYYE